MVIIQVDVSNKIAKRFMWQKVVKIDDILDYQDELKYSFSDEKVSFEELSDFLWKSIESKKSIIC